jgi:N-carbamoyl-L-amino-acid hydrolase
VIGANLEALSQFRELDHPGWTRRVFSDAYVRSREWLANTMRAAGLEVVRDPVGNLIGTLGSGSPAIVTGSHTDTVAGGGRFDGPLGVMAAIEVARCIRDRGVALRHGLRVVDFLGEEPNDFGISCVGSRAIGGTLTAEHLAMRDPSGRTLAEAIDSAGGDSARVSECRWPGEAVRAFVELHIEQGPVLERAGVPVGVVSGIAGIERSHVLFEGRSGHAGTTPMTARHDALCAAAETILALEKLAAREGGVGTVGRIDVFPGATNVVPGRAELWAEVRHTSVEWLDGTRARLAEEVEEIGRRRGVKTTIEVLSRTDPTICAAEVKAAMLAALQGAGVPHLELASGAGHDTVQMARLGPAGMLFVPSAGGLSHCPEEMTLPEHVEAGASALLATVLELDRR